MNDFDTLEGVKKALGVDDVRATGRAPNFAYSYPFSFAALAAGGSADVTQKITAAGAFIVVCTTGVVHDGAGAAILSKLVTVAIAVNEGQWQQAATPWDSIIGTAVQPFYWLFRPVMGRGAQLIVTVKNNTAAAITGTLCMTGYVLGRNAAKGR